MKTIFITLFQGAEVKNIMRTDIYPRLIAEPDVRLVLFVGSPERAESLKKEFAHERVIYEVTGTFKPARLDGFFQTLGFYMIRTATIRLKRRIAYEESHSTSHFFGGILNFILANRPMRRLIRFLDYRMVQDKNFGNYFEKYKPSTVFLAHLFERREINLLREARKRGVRTVGFVNSWDKVTARCGLRLLPDEMIVFNELVKAEVVRYGDMGPERVFIAGLPQYDRYVKEKPIARELFFEKIGIDPKKNLIVYAPMGKTYSNSDWDVIDVLERVISSGKVKNAALLVRFQPNDFFDEPEIKKRPWLKFDRPGIRFSTERGVDWDMSFDDLAHLDNTLAHLSVLVCYASSMSVDAAVFQKPVININFEVRSELFLGKKPTTFYGFSHYRNVIDSGGVKLVKNESELILWLNRYIDSPATDEAARARLIEEQCGSIDGKAGERIANQIKVSAGLS